MNKKLVSYIQELKNQFDEIPSTRKEILLEIARYVHTEIKNSETVKLNFICTHNSRRSHFAQIWVATAAMYLDMDNIETYSGGTEATAFNPRAVAALERAGFKIENPGGENPEYKIYPDKKTEPFICFSKTYDNPVNPSKDFAAVMTCSEADVNCPYIPGAKFRASLPYRDPKESDGTDQESQIYDNRCRQIAVEMFYMMNLTRENV